MAPARDNKLGVSISKHRASRKTRGTLIVRGAHVMIGMPQHLRVRARGHGARQQTIFTKNSARVAHA